MNTKIAAEKTYNFIRIGFTIMCYQNYLHTNGLKNCTVDEKSSKKKIFSLTRAKCQKVSFINILNNYNNIKKKQR